MGMLGAQAATKPHILWITIEDTSPHFIGAYGNRHARTPNIDCLAREGVRFTHAFSTGTVCAPSRFTLITGVRTFAAGTGNHRSFYPIPDFVQGFPTYLRKVGYYTSNNVKTDYNTLAEQRIIRESWNESSGKANWSRRAPGQPFFSVVNFMESHQSRTMTIPYADYQKNVLEKLAPEERIRDTDFDMPPFYRDTPQMRRQVARVYNSLKLTDKRIGELLARLQQDGLADSTIIFLYGDHGEGIPRAKTNAIGLGYQVPFIVYFPPMYRHLSPWKTGMATDELVSFEDLAPTILSLAGAPVPGHLKGRPLLGERRAKPGEFLFLSTDRSDEGADLVRTVTNGRYLYSRNYLPFMAQTRWIKYQEVSDIKKEMRRDQAAGLLNPAQQQLFDPRPAEYLFDLQNDPWELQNLAQDKNLQPLLHKMRKALEANILQTRDVHFLPEYEIAALSANTTAYNFRLQNQLYPISQIYAAASLSGKRGKAIATQQLRLLTSPDKIIRYWAVTGLRSQSPEVLKACRSQLKAALKDAYPPVQVTAAAICLDQFQDQEALSILKRYGSSENQVLSLTALQHIAYLKDIRPFAQVAETVSSRLQEKENYDLESAALVLLSRLGKVQLKL